MPAAAPHARRLKGSPLKGALLALLLELGEPTHAYRLAALLERRLKSVMPVEENAVYKMLKALELSGLVASEVRHAEDAGSSKTRRYYRPTDYTLPAARAWMAAPLSDRAAEQELLIKIAVSQPSDAPVLLEMLQMRANRCLERLKEDDEEEAQDVVAPPSTWKGMTINIVSGRPEIQAESEMEWIVRARKSIFEYSANAGGMADGSL